MPNELKSRVLSGVKWTATARAGAQMITWVISILVIRYLQPDDYGLKAMAEVFFSMLLLMSTAGIGSAIIQAKAVTDDQLRRVFGFLLLINLSLALAQWFAADLIADWYREPRVADVVKVLALGFLIVPFKVIPHALLGKAMEFKKRSLSDLAGAVISSLIMFYLAVAGYGVWALVAGQLIGLLIPTIAYQIVCPYLKLPWFTLRHMGGMLRFGGILLLTDILYLLFSRIDTIIGGRELGADLIGIYAVAMLLASLPRAKIMPLLNQVAFPAYATIQDDMAEIRRYFLKSVAMTSLVTFPFFFGLAAVAEPAILSILGESWRPAIFPVVLLSLSMPLRSLLTMFAPVVNAINRPTVETWNVGFQLVAMTLAFIVGVRWGIDGLVYAWVTVFPLVFIVSGTLFLRALEIGIRDFLRSLMPATLLALMMFGAVAGVDHTLFSGWPQLLRLSADIGVGVIVYGVALRGVFPQQLTALIALFRRA